MARLDPRVQARRTLVADTYSALARVLDDSGLTTAEQVMVLGKLVAAYAGDAVRADHEELSKSPDGARDP